MVGKTMRARGLAVVSVAALSVVGLVGTATAAPFATGEALATRVLVAAKSFTGGKVKINGTAKVGKTLTAKVSGLTPNSESGASYKYQWLRNGENISGANGKTYKVTDNDSGKKISVKVTAHKSGYFDKVMKSETVKIKTAPDGTFEHPFPWGNNIVFTEANGDVIMTMHKPMNVTQDVVNAGALNPATGNAYWLAKLTVQNESTDNFRVDNWGGAMVDGLGLGFEANNGKVYKSGCHYGDGEKLARIVEDAGWPTWGGRERWRNAAPARMTTTKYFCVEAPANAFDSGKFAMLYSGALQWFFK